MQMSAHGSPYLAGKRTAHLTEGVAERQSLVHCRCFVDSSGRLCYPPLKGECRWNHHPYPMKVGALLLTRSYQQRCQGLTLGLLCLSAFLMGMLATESAAKEKPPRAPRPEPELKILDLNITPMPYTQGDGPLQFSVTVQLPRDVDRAMILEVTSLISSPSKTSLRFLTHRQPVQTVSTRNGDQERPKVLIELVWDGLDHRKQVAGAGTYAYEVRTKLLANGDKGPRTMMVAWPKRGMLEVN
jgi:hypothetical protein